MCFTLVMKTSYSSQCLIQASGFVASACIAQYSVNPIGLLKILPVNADNLIEDLHNNWYAIRHTFSRRHITTLAANTSHISLFTPILTNLMANLSDSQTSHFIARASLVFTTLDDF